MIRILFISQAYKDIPSGLFSQGWELYQCAENEIQESSLKGKSFDIAIWHTQSPNPIFTRALITDIPFQFLIILTSACDESNRIAMLQSGVDDILDQSISNEELQLRLKTYQKRLSKAHIHSGIKKIGSYDFNYERRVLSHGAEIRILTTKEAELLNMLAESMNLPLSKHDALIRIWGEDSYHNGRSMDVYIAKLRKYLQFDADIHIMNIHGLGYKLSILS
ncbi:MAG: response regulator transcription factor [Ignavibacteria bacterium]|jgi:two-component system OmpR family response regulator